MDRYNRSPIGFNLDLYKDRDENIIIVGNDKFGNSNLYIHEQKKYASLAEDCEEVFTNGVNKFLMNLLEKKILSIYENFEEERKNGNTDYDYLKDVTLTVEKDYYTTTFNLPIQSKQSEDIGFLRCQLYSERCSVETAGFLLKT